MSDIVIIDPDVRKYIDQLHENINLLEKNNCLLKDLIEAYKDRLDIVYQIHGDGTDRCPTPKLERQSKKWRRESI